VSCMQSFVPYLIIALSKSSKKEFRGASEPYVLERALMIYDYNSGGTIVLLRNYSSVIFQCIPKRPQLLFLVFNSNISKYLRIA
jgi:hypothetical protein